ncbi:hypothetical protein QFZ75_001032 [Streptomyces sp. V3I8]|uniref:hypothetical protein n=1 Tax=Streptomyces sp. V3I8 TaxID=3042279 RepID=UPI00278A613F|nr:hypothetical protein [Streptomyces sp. V3I8]MDQ1034616.1 hypothetical protein [Streptomyces sp. V3I8]
MREIHRPDSQARARRLDRRATSFVHVSSGARCPVRVEVDRALLWVYRRADMARVGVDEGCVDGRLAGQLMAFALVEALFQDAYLMGRDAAQSGFVTADGGAWA